MSAKNRIAESELILHPDGAIYHINLKPHEIADTILVVGDPGRVQEVSKHFDRIEHKKQYREFITHTGYYKGKHLSVLSTGIGADNIDIVMNELDALANIDFETRTVKDELKSLNVIRLGTSGSVHEEVDVDTAVISEAGIGMDGVMNFYAMQNADWENEYLNAFNGHIKPHFNAVTPYLSGGSKTLLSKFEKHYRKGTTITANGFYAPQGRFLRAQGCFLNYTELLNSFRHKDFRITNFEMETATIYSFGKILGHHCLSVNTIVANRITKTFSKDAKKSVEKMIQEVLEIL